MLFIGSKLCDCLSISSLSLPKPLSWRGIKPVANTVLLTWYSQLTHRAESKNNNTVVRIHGWWQPANTVHNCHPDSGWQRDGPELQEGCAGHQNYTSWLKALGVRAVQWWYSSTIKLYTDKNQFHAKNIICYIHYHLSCTLFTSVNYT